MVTATKKNVRLANNVADDITYVTNQLMYAQTAGLDIPATVMEIVVKGIRYASEKEVLDKDVVFPARRTVWPSLLEVCPSSSDSKTEYLHQLNVV